MVVFTANPSVPGSEQIAGNQNFQVCSVKNIIIKGHKFQFCAFL